MAGVRKTWRPRPRIIKFVPPDKWPIPFIKWFNDNDLQWWIFPIIWGENQTRMSTQLTENYFASEGTLLILIIRVSVSSHGPTKQTNASREHFTRCHSTTPSSAGEYFSGLYNMIEHPSMRSLAGYNPRWRMQSTRHGRWKGRLMDLRPH